MNEIILILISGLIAMCVVCPLAVAYDKAKKEMERDEDAQD